MIMGVFVIFISDFRKKTGMVPFVNEKITKPLKFSYFGPLIICGYTLAIMDYLTYLDFLALVLTLLGTIVMQKLNLIWVFVTLEQDTVRNLQNLKLAEYTHT